ncbi:MAG: hypothetical protein R6U89_00725 [Dehalococcoidia bacterium]
MASKEKARALLEASNNIEHYSEMIDHALKYFIAKLEKEGNPCVDELRKLRDTYPADFANAVEITGEVYGEMFTDDELDELIVLNTNPAMEKLRGLTSEIMKRVFEKYSLPPE